MPSDDPGPPISKEVAMEICESVRERNKSRKFSFSAMQCWGCMKATKGDRGKVCWSNGEGNRGCNLINAEFDKRTRKKA